MKSGFKSKTILANVAVAVLVRAWPRFAEVVADYPELYVMIHSGVNILLRLVTRRALRWSKDTTIMVGSLVALMLVSCSSVNQTLEPGLFYKRDVGIEVNGKQYEGVVVIPKAAKYSLLLKPKGNLDLVLLRTCHREFTGEKLSSGFLGIGGGQFKYEYSPIEGIEDSRVCPMRVDVYESGKGRHSWAFLDFEHPNYSIRYALSCNGSVTVPNGVGVCQTKAGLTQRIQAQEPIRFAPPMPVGCAVPMKHGDSYEFQATLGECLYQFDTEAGKLGRLITIGYEGVLVRETQ